MGTWRGIGRLGGAVAALLLVVGGVGAPAGAASKGLVLSSFKLDGTNGYQVEGLELRRAGGGTELAISASRGPMRATYELAGSLGPAMHGTFGSVGTMALDFERRGRDVFRPERRCVWITEVGTYRGRFSFTGEGGYTSASASEVPGEVVRLPNGFCGFGDFRRGLPPLDALHPTQLTARSRRAGGFAEFGASRPQNSRHAEFSARVLEVLGPMTISREATARMRDSFSIGRGKPPRRAAVRPPAPFAGSARYVDPPGAPPRWRGSLRVSLPGLPDVPLAGPNFAARICPRLYLLRKCRVAGSAGGRGHAR